MVLLVETYRTSFCFLTETRSKLTNLQSLLQAKSSKPITKAQAVEAAIDYYIKELSKEEEASA